MIILLKKIFIFFTFLLIFGTSSFISISANSSTINYKDYLSNECPIEKTRKLNYDYTYVQTPMGTNVQVLLLDEFSSSDIETLDLEIAMDYSNAIKIYSASHKYNCHSYAWHSMINSNSYWMNDPSAYYQDGSYSLSTGEVGDIICYYDNDDVNIHSGVVVSTSSNSLTGTKAELNLINVESKWGSCGAYQHRGDQCPYYEDVQYVRYYKPNHNHIYSYTNIDDNNHICACNNCNYTKHQYHSWIRKRAQSYEDISFYYVTYYQCTKCNSISYSVPNNY